MILQPDSLLDFDYDAATDILTVTWPDLLNTPFSEVEHSLQNLSANITHFDVKKLLLDLSESTIGIDEKRYGEMVFSFMESLSRTRLQKIARIMASHPARENLLQQYSREIKSKLTLSFQVRSFTDKAEACAWLQES